MTEPFQVPDEIVPSDVIFPCTAEGNVLEIEGTPPALVIKTPLFPVASPEMVFKVPAYKMVLTAYVSANTAVDQEGAKAELERNIFPVTPDVANIDGTPVFDVTSKPLLPVVNPAITLADEEYSN